VPGLLNPLRTIASHITGMSHYVRPSENNDSQNHQRLILLTAGLRVRSVVTQRTDMQNLE